jgi:alpha-tubulin suppressor-like RCC1 family protein
VYTWGRGTEGQMGVSTAAKIQLTPRFVSRLHGVHVTSVTAGANSVAVLTGASRFVCTFSDTLLDAGALYTWGSGAEKQQCNEPRLAQLPNRNARVLRVSGGFSHFAALTDQNEVRRSNKVAC